MTHAPRTTETRASPAPADTAALAERIEYCFEHPQACTAWAESCRHRESASHSTLCVRGSRGLGASIPKRFRLVLATALGAALLYRNRASLDFARDT